MARMLALAGLLVVAPWALAQEHPDPPRRPEPKPIAPSTPPALHKDDTIPGLEDADFRIGPAPLRREGSFVVRQRGSMVRLPGGEKAFIFHKDAQGKAERPMVLLPCQTLQAMEQVVGDRSEDTVFLVTGQVYAYHNVNYLLPSAAPVGGMSEAKPELPNPTPGTEPGAGDSTKDQPQKSVDPRVDDLIHELEAQRGRPRTLGATPPGVKVVQPGPTDLLPENSTVSLKRGRLVRLANGEWGFAFDNGPAGDAASDRTLVLSPCLNLQRLETWAARLGDGETLLMSGRVFQYQGRNHVIPTMYQLTATSLTGELSPRQ